MTRRLPVTRCAPAFHSLHAAPSAAMASPWTTAAIALATALGIACAPGLARAQGNANGTSVPGTPSTGAARPPAPATVPMTDAQQSGAARTDQRAGSLSGSHVDRRFVTQAHADGLAEIALGKMAAERAATPAARKFGETMVRDHTAANQQLEALAKRKRVALQKDVSPRNKLVAERLARESNEDFDRAYLRGQVRDHEEAIRRFQAEVSGGRDADIRKFAEQTLPKLEQHLQMARDAERQVITSTKPSARADVARSGASAEPAPRR